MQITLKPLVAALAAASALALGGAAAAFAASAPAAQTTGTVHVWVTPVTSTVDRILLTGVIADHGTATTINAAGAVAADGNYVRIALSHGGFKVNAVKFNDEADAVQPKVDKATCSAWATFSGPVTLLDGTGAYAGIKGTIEITTSYAAILARYTSGPKAGQCNEGSNAQPVAQFNGDIIGSGAVSF